MPFIPNLPLPNPPLTQTDTTRAPRPGEKDGREYHFTSRDAFLHLVSEGGFIEHAQFGGNYYGTSVEAVRAIAEEGRVCILDIEMEVCSALSPFPSLPISQP